MKFCVLLSLLPFLVWACTTPPVSPPRPLEKALQPSAILSPTEGPDDDHKSVSRDEFRQSLWKPLPASVSWKPEPTGISVTLSDTRVLRLSFVTPSVLRWWVPAGPGDQPLSPGARYPAPPSLTVITKEVEGVVFLDTPGLGARLRLSDLSLTLVRGDRTILRTLKGPQSAGRRLVQAFEVQDAARWFGPSLARAAAVKNWVDLSPNADETGPFALPALFGAGGGLPFGVVLDNSYQTYTRITDQEVSLGALNGGLDLLVAAAPQASSVVEALSGLTGRPALPPLWAHGTALVLPDSDPGTFVRRAKLAIQTSVGSTAVPRPRFQTLTQVSPVATPLPDLTLPATRSLWTKTRGIAELLPGSGISLPAVPGRRDWNARFDDGGKGSPLARMNNQLPGLEAQAVSEAWRALNPGLRPFVLAGSGSWGTIRQALPEIRVVAGRDEVLPQVLVLGMAGLGTPAVHLDLTPLADPATRSAAFQSLLVWMLAPVLTLDWGPDPSAFWLGLPEPDRQRLKAILDRRAQFKPLFAQTARQASNTGRSAWQPLWFMAPSDVQALARDDEFLLGDGLLAAPVTGGATSRSVYLPGPGVWFDFWSGEEFGGGRAYDLEARPDRPLLFARGGAIVPLREPETFDDKDVYNPLTVHVFPGGRGVGAYYLDDGKTLASQSAYWETKLLYDFAQKDMTLEHQAVNTTGLLKPDPYLLYRIHNVFRPKQVRIDGKPIPLYGDSWGITDTDRSAAWYESDHTLLLKTFRPEREQTIVMSF